MSANKKKSRESGSGAERRTRKKTRLIRLEDLLPKRNVSGGGGGIVFGSNQEKSEGPSRAE
jgi:hypothetical protein